MKKLLIVLSLLTSGASEASDLSGPSSPNNKEGIYGTLNKGKCGYTLEISKNFVSLVSINNPSDGLLCTQRKTKIFDCNDKAYCINTSNPKEGLVFLPDENFYLGVVKNNVIELKTLYSKSTDNSEIDASLFKQTSRILVDHSEIIKAASCSEAAKAVAFRRAYKLCKESGYLECREIETNITYSQSYSSGAKSCQAESYVNGIR